MTAVSTGRPVGVDELRRAWLAVQAGNFRHGSDQPQPGASNPTASGSPRLTSTGAAWDESRTVGNS